MASDPRIELISKSRNSIAHAARAKIRPAFDDDPRGFAFGMRINDSHW
jgi:hypothetical protein